MDQQKLRTLVFEKTGIKIDSTDPVFALVALNEVLLDEAVQRHLGLLEQASKSIIAQLAPMQKGGAATSTANFAHDDIWENSQAEQAAQATHAAALGARQSAENDSAEQPAMQQSPASTAPTPAATTLPSAAPNPYLQTAISAVLSAVLVLLGLAIFAPKPGNDTARSNPGTALAASLSAQQEAQIKQAEKLQKILPKLDPKTRALIEAEMQKP